MGCGVSKPPSLGSGYGMGGTPSHAKHMSKSRGRDVAILWDLDDVACPPTQQACQKFVDGLRRLFVNGPQRKEVALTMVYDGGSVLNCSEEVLALHPVLSSLGINIIESQGPAALVLGLEIQRFCSMAEARSTVVVVGGVLDYHAPCAAAREQGLFVERVYGSLAPLRIVAASQANWQSSVADVLQEMAVPDWRTTTELGPAIRFKSAIASEWHGRSFKMMQSVGSGESLASSAARVCSMQDGVAEADKQIRKAADAPCQPIPEEVTRNNGALREPSATEGDASTFKAGGDVVTVSAGSAELPTGLADTSADAACALLDSTPSDALASHSLTAIDADAPAGQPFDGSACMQPAPAVETSVSQSREDDRRADAKVPCAEHALDPQMKGHEPALAHQGSAGDRPSS